MEFSLRPYTESDATPCGECLYEGFFTGPIDENDRRFLREYAQVLIEKCNFTYVAETEAGQVVGFVCGKYSKPFSPALANRYETKKHYGLWCRMFFQFYLKVLLAFEQNGLRKVLLSLQKVGEHSLEVLFVVGCLGGILGPEFLHVLFHNAVFRHLVQQ